MPGALLGLAGRAVEADHQPQRVIARLGQTPSASKPTSLPVELATLNSNQISPLVTRSARGCSAKWVAIRPLTPAGAAVGGTAVGGTAVGGAAGGGATGCTTTGAAVGGGVAVGSAVGGASVGATVGTAVGNAGGAPGSPPVASPDSPLVPGGLTTTAGGLTATTGGGLVAVAAGTSATSVAGGAVSAGVPPQPTSHNDNKSAVTAAPVRLRFIDLLTTT
ncbi:MAG: hypothetical protein DCC51_15255 [Anaerolineae bacterium]|nr:MAG: hypothetical protein DCC51_15255 [Anaerolineae bacterium]